jgi:hypothetical protein
MEGIARRAVLGAALVTLGAGPTAVSAAAAGTTLRFYNVQETVSATDAAGTPLPNGGSGTAPLPGYRIAYTGLDYLGDHQRHASKPTASNHLACTFVTASSLMCNAQVAIGGLLLLGNDVTATLGSGGVSSIPINAGTGKYQHARGVVTVTPIPGGPNADVTVTLDGSL